MKPKDFALILVICIALMMQACSGAVTGSARPPATVFINPVYTPPSSANSQSSSTSQTQGTPQVGLFITSTSSYTDSLGNFHVVGEIKNGEPQTLTDMELTLIVKDADGKTLLSDPNQKPVDSLIFSPEMNNLAAGETSPFETIVDAIVGIPAKFDVTVTGQQTSTLVRPKIRIMHTQMKPSTNNSYFITGEVVNLSDQPVRIHALAGAMLDSNNNVISSAASLDYSAYLEPAGDSNDMDTTPFIIMVDNPGSSPAHWKTYLDAEAIDPINGFDVSIDISNHYMDDNNIIHIIGSVTNNTQSVLLMTIVAGLYDGDGSVLDAYASITPVHVAPGENVPYDISTFGNVNNNATEAARLDNFSVQIDSDNTWEPSIETVDLSASNGKVEKNGNTWTFTGQVTNTSAQVLSSETVVVTMYDENNTIMAMNWLDLFPSGNSIASGEVLDYSIDVYLDPEGESSNYTYITLVQGDVK